MRAGLRPGITVQNRRAIKNETWDVSSNTLIMTNENGQNIALKVLNNIKEKWVLFLLGKENIGNPEAKSFLGHKVSIVIGKKKISDIKGFDDPYYDKYYPVLLIDHAFNRLYYLQLAVGRIFYNIHQSKKLFNLYGSSNFHRESLWDRYGITGDKKALSSAYLLVDSYDKFINETFAFYFFPPLVPASPVKIDGNSRMNLDFMKVQLSEGFKMFISRPIILFLLAFLTMLFGIGYIHSIFGILSFILSLILFGTLIRQIMKNRRNKEERMEQVDSFSQLLKGHLEKIGERLLRTETIESKNQTVKNEKFCQYCGNEIQITDRFCTNCGSKII